MFCIYVQNTTDASVSSLFSLTADFEPSLLARASHSAVMWGQDMVVYGGYRFPLGDGRVDVGSGAGSGGGSDAGSGAGSGERDRVEQAEVLLYHFATHTWEVLEAQSGTKRPETRYGHSAVVYNVSHLSGLCSVVTSFPGSSPVGNEVLVYTHA